MESIRTYLLVWLAGLLAGLVLVERWRRIGTREVQPVATVDGTMAPLAPSSAPTPAPAAAPTIWSGVAAGAKSDVDNFRNVLRRVTTRG